MITGHKVVYNANHLLTHSLIHSLAHSLTHSILFVPGGTQGYNKRASLLSVCSPFGDGVPCPILYSLFPMSGRILYSLFSMFISMFLLPSAFQRKAILGNAPGDSRHTCPTISVFASWSVWPGMLNLFLSITVHYGTGVFCLVVVPRQFDFCIVES